MSKEKYQPLVGKDQQLLISLTICSTFHSVLWNWKQIWQKAVIWFSCNSIIYHEKYSFINNYLFWNDSSCHFWVCSSPQWGIFLSLSIIKSCSVQCVWNLVWMHFTMCLCFVMCIISFLLYRHEIQYCQMYKSLFSEQLLLIQPFGFQEEFPHRKYHHFCFVVTNL